MFNKEALNRGKTGYVTFKIDYVRNVADPDEEICVEEWRLVGRGHICVLSGSYCQRTGWSPQSNGVKGRVCYSFRDWVKEN